MNKRQEQNSTTMALLKPLRASYLKTSAFRIVPEKRIPSWRRKLSKKLIPLLIREAKIIAPESCGKLRNILKSSKSDWPLNSTVLSANQSLDYIGSLGTRKEEMMLPQYAKKYLSFHALRAYIMVNVPDHVEFTCEVKVDLFISVVRGRHFVVSMWTHIKPDNVNEEETEDSTFSSNSVSLIGEGKLCQIRGIKERKGESFTIFSRKTKDPIGLGVDVGDSLSDLFDKACMVGCDLLWRSIGRRFHRFEEEIKKGEDVADIFSGVLVALDSPLPTDFGTSRDLMQCREKRDWHCEAAMFLPYVFSSSKDYFPDYLHHYYLHLQAP